MTVQATPLASSNSSDVTEAALSGCQVCASTGDCSHAYMDAPGQFCGNWLDRASQRQRCCCPRKATCDVSNYACKCRTSKTKAPTSSLTSTTGSSSSSRASWGTIFGSVVVLFVASSILWCLCPCCRANRYAALSQPAMTPVVVQAPAAYAPGHANAYAPGYAPGYAYAPGPVYGAPVYGGGGYPNGGGMGAGSSAMLGGVAGMFGGLLVGQALSNAGGHHGYHGGSDNTCYADNGGGEEFGGDF
ncbi:hypothetical protein PHYSODRAFT_531319 [Phytophthora sojae]|uniref:Uncharacterized protein n=1 Tax=Phytophthora sojae (strain P6497) TaxID=1094619 RepID=G5AD59_PHYSP|nr:hypothetical protein PHYSODRAFT_531319 [Phytophthora sojae]EGZ06113.1 hypothetical protein PHYSODRAFT_531319 [Phytophthora sojae]|eukprot:XP_009538010.1 hypothetical protein PHYSODRAFT_531319 [Phytophthora sojae]